MPKIKLCLDTSAINHLWQTNSPLMMGQMRKLWAVFLSGRYDVCLAAMALRELKDCARRERAKHFLLMNTLARLKYGLLRVGEAEYGLAEKMVGAGILGERRFVDCLHLAAAITQGCQAMVSCDLAHMANATKAQPLGKLAVREGYPPITVLAPGDLL